MPDESFSCVKRVNKIVHIALPSAFVTNEVAGVTQILESWKRQYVHQLQGVVVGYKNIFLTSSAGYVIVDKPFIHYDVKATFSLFCPSVGNLVKGTINRISREHVGCLILNTINVTIDLSEQTPEEFSKYVALDREIIFQISHFDFQRRVIRVQGKITEECIEIMETMFPDCSTLGENELISGTQTGSVKSKSGKKIRSSGSLDLFSSKESDTDSDSKSTVSFTTFSADKNLEHSSHEIKSENSDVDYSRLRDEMKGESENIINNLDKAIKLSKKKKHKEGDSSSQYSMSQESETSSHKSKRKKSKRKATEMINFDFPIAEVKEEVMSATEELLPETVENYSANKKKRKQELSQENSLGVFQNEGFSEKKRKKTDSSSSQQSTVELPSAENSSKKKKRKQESSMSGKELLPEEKNHDSSLNELEFSGSEYSSEKKKKHKGKINLNANENEILNVDELKDEPLSNLSEEETVSKIKKTDASELLEFLASQNFFGDSKESDKNIKHLESLLAEMKAKSSMLEVPNKSFNKEKKKAKDRTSKSSKDRTSKSSKDRTSKSSKDKTSKSSKDKTSKSSKDRTSNSSKDKTSKSSKNKTKSLNKKGKAESPKKYKKKKKNSKDKESGSKIKDKSKKSKDGKREIEM